jgi:hypothetical protein
LLVGKLEEDRKDAEKKAAALPQRYKEDLNKKTAQIG